MLFWHVSIVLCVLATIAANAEEQPSSPEQSPTKQQNVNLSDPVVCDCGFIDESNNIWSDVWYADYGTYQSSLQYDRHYLVMDYTVTAKYNNTLDRIFSPNNVKLSKQDGITLLVQRNSHGQYTSAAVGTKRSDFLYGTYRARIKTSNVAGTVAAFFFYRNDTSEIDMESLSRLNNPYKTYFAIQPQIYNTDGSASSLTNEKHELQFNSTEDYHEYRFDWTPGSVKFYIDSTFIREMTANIPDAPGRVLLNHWTDGNPRFSGGPPTESADLKISHLNMFFNSSETKAPPQCQKSKTPCKVSDIMNRNLLPGNGATSSSNNFVIPALNNCLAMTLLCLLVYFYL